MADDKKKPAKPRPAGETPAEATERIAPSGRRVSYSISLEGSGDQADPAAVERVFGRFVRALRSAGVTVNGGLTGQAPATRHEKTGDLTPEVVLHTLAADVE